MSEVKENGLVRFVVIALVASIGLLPMVFYGCSPEWARWDASQANAFFRKGETSDALYQLRDAIRKSPRDPVLRLTLAKRLIELDRPTEALDLCNEVLDVYSDNISAMQTKSEAEQRMGDFEASLETQLKINKNLHAYLRKSHSLNGLAYARALAGKDLHLAKEDIDAAVNDLNGITGWPMKGGSGLRLEVKAIIVAALISRWCDAQGEMFDVMESEIDSLRDIANLLRSDLTEEVYDRAQDAFPVRQNLRMRNRRQELRFFETQVAALLSCRALLFQDLGKTEQCQDDRLEVQSLDYDSSELVAEFPDDMTCLMQIEAMWPVLDTRGFICSLLPWREELIELDEQQENYLSSYAQAIRDLNVAILCNQIVRKSFESSLQNSVARSFDRDRELKNLERHCAVLLYHRMLLHERRGNAVLAAKDSESIQALGLEPGPQLY